MQLGHFYGYCAGVDDMGSMMVDVNLKRLERKGKGGKAVYIVSSNPMFYGYESEQSSQIKPYIID